MSLENIEGRFKITEVVLETKAKVPEIEIDTFLTHAEDAKANCPVSQALLGTKIKLVASLNKVD